MLNISQVILMRTDSNLCRKELMVHWSAPNSLIRSYLQPCTNSMWGDESEAVAPIIWLFQIVDAQKEEVCFPELLITLRSYDFQTLFSCYRAALRTLLSVCPFVCLSARHTFLTMFVSSYRNFQELLPLTDVMSMQKVKVTEVMTPFSRFRTVTPVWIHIWRSNDAESLMLLRRGALLLFKVIRQISRSGLKKNCWFWPKLGVSRL